MPTNILQSERSTAFNLAFGELRRNARSLNDIKAWCYRNQRLLIAECGGEQPSAIIRDALHLQMGGGLVYGGVDLPGCRPLTSTMHDADSARPLALQFDVHFNEDECIDFEYVFCMNSGLFITDVKPGGLTSSQAKAYAFAEDWSFVGATTLQLFDPAEGFHEDHRRVLEACFPGLAWDVFLSFKEQGWAPEGRTAFIEWLFGFANVTEPTKMQPELPDLT